MGILFRELSDSVRLCSTACRWCLAVVVGSAAVLGSRATRLALEWDTHAETLNVKHVDWTNCRGNFCLTTGANVYLSSTAVPFNQPAIRRSCRIVGYRNFAARNSAPKQLRTFGEASRHDGSVHCFDYRELINSDTKEYQLFAVPKKVIRRQSAFFALAAENILINGPLFACSSSAMKKRNHRSYTTIVHIFRIPNTKYREKWIFQFLY